MKHELVALTLVAAISAACGHPAQLVPLAQAPCLVAGVGTADAPWRQVRGAGFTFCVPGDWTPSGSVRHGLDANQWNGSGSSLTWDTGRVPEGQQRAGDITGSVVQVPSSGAGAAAPVRVTAPATVRIAVEPCPQATTTPRVVDGVVLFVTRGTCQGLWVTRAWRHAPAVYVQGTAESADGAQQLLAVVQSIRFASPAH